MLVGLDPLPEVLLYEQEVAASGIDLVVCTACMIKGHFPNSCYEEFLKCLRPGGYIAFTIRDIYLDSATDNGMNFHGKLKELVEGGKLVFLKQFKYTKYKGLQFGSGHMEEVANIMLY